MSALILCLVLLCICGLKPVAVKAQIVKPDTSLAPARDTFPHMVNIEHADRLKYKKIDTTNELTIGAGNVIFRDGKTLVYCDSAVHNKNKKIVEAFGNVHIIDSDTIHTYSKYLIYHSDTKIANLEKQVKLTDGKTVLTTDNLDYDTNLKIGIYRNGGKIVSEKTVITSREAIYYSELKDVYFKKNVKFKDPATTLIADSLLYNTSSQLVTFITDTNIKDTTGKEIFTSSGTYDLKNKKSQLTGRSTIRDKTLIVSGNEIATDDSTGMLESRGNVVIRDTVNKTTILANNVKANRKNNTFLATQHPLVILERDNDSTFITADTLYSGTFKEEIDSLNKTVLQTGRDSLGKTTTALSKEDSTNRNRFFIGWYHVRIFSDSMQAVSDSLFYSGRDSTFKLFKDPILWANKSQVTGDTIYLHTINKKPDHLKVFENAMMINLTKNELYNQLKGTTIDAWFRNGEIDFVESVGSPAESVYYIQDEDSAFVGMNTATARSINMYFLTKELNKVVYKKEVAGTMYPILQVPSDKKVLKDFKWQDNRRPKTKFELFEDIIEPEAPSPTAPAEQVTAGKIN